MGQKPDKNKKIEQEKNYVSFLKKRLESENFKKAVTDEQFQKEKKKYDKAKLKLKLMQEGLV